MKATTKTRKAKLSKQEIIANHPDLYMEVIKEGIELALNGHTDVSNVDDVLSSLGEIKQKWADWEQREEEYLKFII